MAVIEDDTLDRPVTHTSPPIATTEASPEASARPTLRQRILREPLTHFVLIGLAIFAVMHVVEARSARYLIRVGPEEKQRIALGYQQQFGSAPDPAQLRALIDERIRQEVFLHEARALGLDREDEVVRRRIAQKYEFLVQDNITPRTPGENELRQWYNAHRQAYTLPARRTFDHVYFAIDERGEDAARKIAQAAEDSAAHGGPVPVGDVFPGTKVIRLLSQIDAGRLFGENGFAESVFAAPQGTWVGPLRSGFGWHIVRVTETQPGELRGYATARDDVLRDWTEADRTAQNRAAYDKLRARYRVELGE